MLKLLLLLDHISESHSWTFCKFLNLLFILAEIFVAHVEDETALMKKTIGDAKASRLLRGEESLIALGVRGMRSLENSSILMSAFFDLKPMLCIYPILEVHFERPWPEWPIGLYILMIGDMGDCLPLFRVPCNRTRN